LHRGELPLHRISIIVPAHNEQNVLGRCLSSMLDQAVPGELEIIVAANGCSDATADVARSFGDDVRVIELAEASKHRALAAADSAAREFPRLYVDADVVLGTASLRAVADALRNGPARVAAPKLRVRLEKSSWAVRAYYRIWLQLPYHANGTIGSGVYGLSKSGRKRFESFPDLISDDGFVRLNFEPHERLSVPQSYFEIVAPRDMANLLGVKTRSQKGWRQLRERFPELVANNARDRKEYPIVLRSMAFTPTNWLAALVYAFVAIVTKARAWELNRSGRLADWERDETSRDTRSESSR